MQSSPHLPWFKNCIFWLIVRLEHPKNYQLLKIHDIHINPKLGHWWDFDLSNRYSFKCTYIALLYLLALTDWVLKLKNKSGSIIASNNLLQTSLWKLYLSIWLEPLLHNNNFILTKLFLGVHKLHSGLGYYSETCSIDSWSTLTLVG